MSNSDSYSKGSKMGVSGSVEYDLTIQCFADSHEPQPMLPTDELSDKNNPILKCPDCETRRAVDVHVAPLGGGS